MRNIHTNILNQMIVMATSAFSLVAALAWNEVVREAVNTLVRPYFAKGSGLVSLLIYALVITTITVVATYQLSKLNPSPTKRKKRKR